MGTLLDFKLGFAPRSESARRRNTRAKSRFNQVTIRGENATLPTAFREFAGGRTRRGAAPPVVGPRLGRKQPAGAPGPSDLWKPPVSMSRGA